jgi:hypothetical protein
MDDALTERALTGLRAAIADVAAQRVTLSR